LRPQEHSRRRLTEIRGSFAGVDLLDDFATHGEKVVRGDDPLLSLDVRIRPKRIGRRLEEAVRLRRLAGVDRSANDLAADRALK
jgi:hypothetical protein